MKVLTIRQPWASLIALGEKHIETRSWRTNYRGELLIHAGKSINKESCMYEPIKSVLEKHGYDNYENLPIGMIIAKCELVDCQKIIELDDMCGAITEGNLSVDGNEYLFGDFTPGRYAWILNNIEILKKPIPAKGQLSLWEYRE
jgi:hypothetical protein